VTLEGARVRVERAEPTPDLAEATAAIQALQRRAVKTKKEVAVLRRFLTPLLVLAAFAGGCKAMTPEQQAAAASARAALDKALAEYEPLKAELDKLLADRAAGKPLSEAALARLGELVVLLPRVAAEVQVAAEALRAAQAAGAPWYACIPWQGIAGVILSLLGVYFPVIRPLVAQRNAIIAGVEASGSAEAKTAIAAEAAAAGVSAGLHAAVRKLTGP
jgi:hypothetical protein